MKGNTKLISVLNSLLADELTAVNKYMVHSEMCENWVYNKLHKAMKKQAMDEMHDVDWAETQNSQIEQMGLKNYLVNQTDGQES